MPSIIARAPGLPGAAQLASSTAEAYFDDNTGVDALVTVSFDQLTQVIGQNPRAGLSGASAAIQTVVCRPFQVHAWGVAVGSAAGNLTINLDQGNSTTISSNTTVFTSGACALETDDTLDTWEILGNFMLSAGVTSRLQGYGDARVANVAIPTHAIFTESTEDLIAGGVTYFKVSGTLSSSDANHRAVMCGLVVKAD